MQAFTAPWVCRFLGGVVIPQTDERGQGVKQCLCLGRIIHP